MTNLQQAADAAFESVGDDGLFPNHSDKDIWINGFQAGATSPAAKEYWEAIRTPPDFLEYVKDERHAFICTLLEHELNTEMRTAAESLIIAYDQMMTRLTNLQP